MAGNFDSAWCRALTDGIIEAKTGHGFYGSWPDYAAYVAIFAMGRWIQPKHIQAAIGTGLLAAVAFFLISNLAYGMPHEAGQYRSANARRTDNLLRECHPICTRHVPGDIGFTVVFIGALQLLVASTVKNEVPASTETASIDA
ncbi:MAG: DUF6580 family putative transport protein [Planctomycetaceae bacterium]